MSEYYGVDIYNVRKDGVYVGTISPTSSSFPSDSYTTLTYTIKDAYKDIWGFKNWVTAGVDLQSSTSTNPNAFAPLSSYSSTRYITLELNDLRVYYNVTITQPSYGTISGDSGSIVAGTSKTYTYSPVSGYEWSWNCSGGGSNWAYSGTSATCTINANATVAVTVKAATLKVTLDANGGTVDPDEIAVDYGGTYSNLIDPTWAGHTFNGWYYNGTLITSSSTVTATTDHTLVASWSDVSCTISYESTYSTSGAAPSSGTVAYGNDYTLAGGGTLARTSYTLTGWCLDSLSGTVYGLTDTLEDVTSNHTMYPKWTANVTLRFDGNGATGGSAPSSQTGASGSSFTMPTEGTLVKTNYTFLGWSTNSSATTASYIAGSSYTFSSTTTLYAVWSSITYTISYEDNDATSGYAPASGTVTAGNDYTLAGGGSLARTGYTLTGWRLDSYTTGTVYSLTGTLEDVASNHTMYPVWEEITYKVGYYANEGTGTISDQYYAAGTVITLSDGTAFSRTDYNRKQWRLNGTGGDPYALGGSYTVPQYNSTFYMEWESIPTYTLSLPVSPSGGGSTTGAGTYKAGVDISISASPETGYGFSYWGSYVNCSVHGTSGQTQNVKLSGGGNASVTAYFTKETHTITYEDNDATSGAAPTSGSVSYGDNYTLAGGGTLARTGYTLTGWRLDDYSSGTIYALTGTLSNVTSDHIMYPKWTANVTLRFDGNGATGGSSPSSQTGVSGSSFTMPGQNTLYKTNYTFLGWSTNSSASTASYIEGGSYTFSSTTTLYAVWERESYTISYESTYSTSGSAPSSGTVAVGGDYTLAGGGTLARTAYTLTGWCLDSLSGTVYSLTGTISNVNSDHTMYPKWTANVTIRFDGNGATSGTAPDSQTGVSGSSFTMPTNGSLAKDDCTFLGWSTSSSATTASYIAGSSYTFSSSKTLYAVWAKNKYQITFTPSPSGSGTITNGTSGTYESGTVFNLTAVPTQGTQYVFSSWSLSPSDAGTLVTSGGGATYTSGSKSAIITCNFVIPTYTVNVTQPSYGVINKGSSQAPSSESHIESDTVEYSAVPDSGYEFASWSLSGGGSLSSTTSSTTILTVGSSDCTLTCSFVQSGPTVYVVPSVYGGGELSLSASVVTSGTTITYTTTPTSVNSALDSIEVIAGSATINTSAKTIVPTTDCEVRAIFKRTSKVTPTETSTTSKKYKILVYTYGLGYNTLLTMNGDGNTWYSDLKFSKKLNEVGSGSFTLYSKSSTGIVGDKIDIGSHIIILQDNYPVYYGYITEYNKDDINFYGDHSYSGINQYTITFNDILRELNYENNPYDSQVITGTPKFIVYAVLGGSRRLGNVYSSNSTISFTISSQNRLSLLDNLSDQIGWRYRSHAHVTNVIPRSYISSAPVSGTSGTLTFSTTIRNSGDRVIISNGDSCHIYTIYPSAASSSFSFTYGVHTDNVALGSDAVAYFIDDYAIDFAPSFFQTNSIVNPDTSIPSTVGNNKAWGINYKAKNVKSDDSVNTQYGSVSVSSTNGNGSLYTATIPLKQIHNSDYTFNNSTYVKQSCDYYCCDWDWQPSYSSTSGRLFFDVYGSNVGLSTTPFSYSSYIVLIDRVTNKCQIFNTPQSRGDNGTNSETGIPITHLYFDISQNDLLYTRLETGDLEPYLIMSDYYILQDSSMNNVTSFYIGGESGSGTISGNQLYINRSITSGNYYTEPKVHTIGTLVIKNQTTPATGSPYDLYSSRTLFGQMQSGSSYMDVDLVASSFAVFGSNFDSNGTANVSLPFFVKDDSSVDMIHGLPEVGDHIAFYDSSKSNPSAISDYELLSYELDVNTLSNKIKYGTYAPTLGSTLYNLRKNTTTNIVRG